MNQDTFEQKAMALLSEALEQPSPDREDWIRRACGDDLALANRVLSLLQADQASGDVIRTGGVGEDIAEPELPERVGAYQVTSLIGQGGMGAVYEGRRDSDDFEHRVAIKVVRPGVMSEALVERFQRERQILASLNHPNIARLFDGGQALDGSPFIIMEFVEGVPITEWVSQRELSLKDRLSLFSEVCAAVSHAHQNLIVHRDITPSNVLVTNDGRVKLIDFGIAKPQSDEEAMQSADVYSLASLSFTPGFAAPERSKGASATTLSDVYSLGKLLEAVLSGVTGSKDLKAIIEHASAEQPDARYPSVTALADDIEHCRSGYPVSAVKGGALYRFGKYVARRKLLVTSLVVGLVAILGALGSTWVQYQRAEEALVRANARFEQARNLSRAVIFDAYDEFAKVSGTLEARRNLANLVSDYVDQLASDKAAPQDILLDIGVMNNRLSDLFGGIGLANLGDTDKSNALLQSADAALEGLLKENPDNSDALAELIMVKRGLSMQALIYDINTEDAMRINNDALRYAERGVQFSDDNERTFLRHFWSARTDRLQILLEMRNLQEALDDVQPWRAELDEAMFERLGGGEEMAAYLAVQEAQILIELDRPQDAITPLTYARSYRSQQLEATPDSYYQMTQLMVVLMELSRSYNRSEDYDEAVRASAEAVTLARTIMAFDEEDAGGPEGLNATLQNYASYLLKSGEQAQALEAANEAVSLAQGLVRQFSDDVYYERILMMSLVTQTEVGGVSSALSCERFSTIRMMYDDLVSGDVSSEKLGADTLERINALEASLECN